MSDQRGFPMQLQVNKGNQSVTPLHASLSFQWVSQDSPAGLDLSSSEKAQTDSPFDKATARVESYML